MWRRPDELEPPTSEDDYKLAEFRKNKFDRDDVKAMLWAAFKVFTPGVLLLMGIIALFGYLLYRWL